MAEGYKIRTYKDGKPGEWRDYEPKATAKGVGAALEEMGGMLGKAAKDIRQNKYKVDRYE